LCWNVPLYSFTSRGSFLYFKNIELGNLKSFYTSLLITLLLPVVLQTLVCALVVLWGVSAFGSSLMRFDDFLKFEDNTISFCDWFHKRKQYSLCRTHTSFLKPHNVKKEMCFVVMKKSWVLTQCFEIQIDDISSEDFQN
jgi:hypothetical protein